MNDNRRNLVTSEVLDGGKHRAVILRYTDATGTEHVGHGVSFKNPDDKDDPAVGLDLAAGRALKSLGRQIERNAWKRVKRNDKIRAKEMESREQNKLKREANKQNVAHTAKVMRAGK